MLLFDKLLGVGDALNVKRYSRMVDRDKLSDYLPYRSWDEKTGAYKGVDDTYGYVWECVPLVYAGADVFDTLKGCVHSGIPEGSVLQFMLYADPDIESHLAHYMSLKSRRNPFIDTLTNGMTDFLSGAEFGLKSTNNIPVRNFRLLVSLKFPAGDDLRDNYEFAALSVAEALRGAGLNPLPVAPGELIALLSKMLNTKANANVANYDPDVEIRKQIISAGLTETKFGFLAQRPEKVYSRDQPLFYTVLSR